MKSLKLKRMKEVELLENIILELEHWKPGKNLSQKTLDRTGGIYSLSQKDAIITSYKISINLLKETPPDDGKLYLTEIIEKEKPEFGSNNLILAPVGSGKTNLIKNVLIKNQKGKILMLVSNTTLKDSTCPNDLEWRERKGHNMFTSKVKQKFGDELYEIHVMTYSEFGNKIYRNNDFVDNVVQIHCDEIHSLPDYQQYTKDIALAHAIKYLFDNHINQQIFYFTATDEHLKSLEKRIPGTLSKIKTFDYRNHKDIKKYMALSEYKINHIEQIRPHLKARLNSFNYFGYKALAFSRTIKGQKRIEKIAIEEGFKPLSLWSINNKKDEFKMTKEQLEARDFIINFGKIPKPYNLLIINSAMQEGWDLIDEKVKLAIMNTTNETEHIQALGRIRKDIDILIYRTAQEKLQDIILNVPEMYLNVPLTTKLKSDLCSELSILNAQGKLCRWKAVKSQLEVNGYVIEEGYETIDGKRTRVSTIKNN